MYDRSFYNMCVQDNEIIFQITGQEKVNIPQISLINLKDIIYKKIKLGKAFDILQLFVEHLRHAGDETQIQILIIDNISYLSSPQLNTAFASVVYKNKPVTHHLYIKLHVRMMYVCHRLFS